jgi:DNA-directed RNA polymerase specialized sigma24 family protein
VVRLYRGAVRKKLLSYARYLIRDEDAAVDAVQNAFIKAYVNLNGFDTNKKFSTGYTGSYTTKR